ncbi:hypothetical protein ACJ41O_002816 [Fusarium nematophilum]
MLTSVGRAAARRIQTTSLHSSSSTAAAAAAAAQFLSRQTPVATAISIRSFSVSSWAQLPAPGSKKSPAKKTATGKASTTKPKQKKAKVKAKAVEKPKEKPKKPKKEVDPEKKKKLEIRELKKWTLNNDKPSTLPATTWTLFLYENREESRGVGIAKHVTELSRRFKALSGAEIKDLENRAAANREENVANLKAWVEGHEPARIYIANSARRRIAFLTGKNSRAIEDERLPKQPTGSYSIFVAENFSKFGGSGAVEGLKAMGQAWKQVSAAEKKEYEERAAEVSTKYHAEMEILKARAEEIKAAAKEE